MRSGNPANDAKTPLEWTLAVDLAAGKPSGLDSSQQEKLASLKKFQSKTKDIPVAVVIQEIQGNPRYGEDGRAHQPFILNRYLLKNGQLRNLETTYSSGLAADTASLLNLAAKNQPAKKLGLFLHCHGSGNRGLRGDAGTADMDEFVKQITPTLKSTYSRKLDILNLDCCLMAQDGVLSKTQTIAKSLVASSEAETAIPGIPCQNTSKALEALLDTPDMNGSKFGDKIIQQAKDGANSSTLYHITTTASLAHFRLEQNYSGFHRALDSFGSKLAILLADSANKVVMENIIAQTPRLSATWFMHERYTQQVDLKCFAEQVRQGIQQRAFSGRQDTLLKSIDQLLQSHTKLVRSYAGAQQGQAFHSDLDYSQLGGLNVFLPSKQFRNIAAKSKYDYLELLSASRPSSSLWSLRFQYEGIKKDLGKTEKSEPALKPLAEIVAKSETSKVMDTSQQLEAEFRQRFSQFMSSPDYTKLHEQKIAENKKQLLDFYQKQLLSENQGWSKFVRALDTK